MNLQQLKNKLTEQAVMTMIYEQIEDVANSGEGVATFGELDKFQIAHLEVNGYEVRWDRVCMWYEVSGWQ